MTAHYAGCTHPRAIAVVLIALALVVGCEGSAPTAPTHGAAGMPGPTMVPLPFLSGSGGGVIAFVSERTGNYDIYVTRAPHASAGAAVPDGTDADGTEQGSGDPRRLMSDDAADCSPAWSPAQPEGGTGDTRIAFYSERDGNQEIYVVGADGSSLQRLTHDDADDFHPAWSPGGTQIAFISKRDGSDNVYVMDADGSNPRRLTNTRVGDESPTWSPSGTRIAFASEHDGDGEIYAVDVQEALQSGGADVSALQRLTSNHVGDYCPVWRPHGNNGGP